MNLVTNILREAVNVVCGFILPNVIIRSFGSEVYGLTESITNFLGFIVLLEAGFGPVVKVALYKALAKKDTGQIKRILKTSECFFRKIAFLFLAYVLGLALLYPVISDSGLNYSFTATLVLIMAASTFAEYFFGITYRLFLQSDQKTYVTNIIQITITLLNLGLIVTAIKFGADIMVVKIITSLVFILKPVIQNVYIRKKYKILPNNSKENYAIEQKWDALVHHVAFMIHSKTDIVILTIMSSLKNVAIYSVYALVLNGIKSIISVVADSFSAAFGDMIAKSEKDVLVKRFNSYETFYITISTIVYSSTLTLITPLIAIYTSNIKDADYIQPAFGILLTIGVYLLTIRQPYNELVKAAGHFKQTRNGALIEATINILVSITTVWKFGLIGVAIGTLAAMLFRTVDFIIYANRKILDRNVWKNIKKMIVAFFETSLIVMVSNMVHPFEVKSYLDWILYAAIIAAISVIVVMPVNYLLYKNDFKDLLKILKKVTRRSNKQKQV